MLNASTPTSQLQHLHLAYCDQQYAAMLCDSTGDVVLRGYGRPIIEPINDLHYNTLQYIKPTPFSTLTSLFFRYHFINPPIYYDNENAF